MESNRSHPVPTLYDWAGGQKLQDLFQLFYDKVLNDPLIGPVFQNMAPDHRLHVARFVGEVFGGPRSYTEGEGKSHAVMVQHHIGKLLTEAQRRRWIALLLDTADEVGLPADAEFRSAFVAYLEWGSRIAVVNSQRTDNPVGPSEPMPQWGWGVPGGPYQPEA